MKWICAGWLRKGTNRNKLKLCGTDIFADKWIKRASSEGGLRMSSSRTGILYSLTKLRRNLLAEILAKLRRSRL